MKFTTNIFGYNFICDTSYEALSDEIIAEISSGTLGISNFITPNAHGINMYAKYPELNEFCKHSKYVLPDGQPLVWLSKFTKHPIKKRLTGSDFFPVIFNKVKTRDFRCLFILSKESLKEKFLSEKPDASFIIPEFFEMNEPAKLNAVGDLMVSEIVSRNLNYVFIGISEPKQGALAKNVTEKLQALNYKSSCLFFFLGASYEFYFGIKKRAPAIFQKTGMEWFYRLLSEPKRMYKRYIFGNFIFILKAIKWLLTKKSEL
ncbi:hypothetical protein CNR22_19340 [Sphingobacteriaceae bacterium]|nr:hypothetical protein CNR22_19340 [Sphingobacteriaceae bacterium]